MFIDGSRLLPCPNERPRRVRPKHAVLADNKVQVYIVEPNLDICNVFPMRIQNDANVLIMLLTGLIIPETSTEKDLFHNQQFQ